MLNPLTRPQLQKVIIQSVCSYVYTVTLMLNIAQKLFRGGCFWVRSPRVCNARIHVRVLSTSPWKCLTWLRQKEKKSLNPKP